MPSKPTEPSNPAVPSIPTASSEDRAFTRIAYSMMVIVLMITVGAFVFHALEGLSWVDSFYFATVTLTTVGYGDITPRHDVTKIFIIFYALIGVATVLFLLTNIARFYIERRERSFEGRYERIKASGFRIPHPPRLPSARRRR